MDRNKSQEIVDFIKRRFYNNDANWLYGNCYWFAKILKERFNELDIYYEPVRGHFLAGIDDNYYDWTGLVTKLDSKPILLEEIKLQEPNIYKRLLEDCIL